MKGYQMIETPPRGGLREGLKFGYVDVPADITPADRPFLDSLTEASMALQKEIRKDVIDVRTDEQVVACDAGSFKVRIYLPDAAEPAPLLLFYHGGGFAIRDVDCFDYIARYLCKNAGAVVVSPEYCLAPEYKFPTQIEQCYTALLWARDAAADYGADPLRDIVFGDSAGGYLSTVISLMCLDRKERVPSRQILAYPVVDNRPDVGRESERLYATDYNLDYKHMVSYTKAYLRDLSEAESAYGSPLLAPSLSGLPPCRMISAECDILIDQGMEYLQRLKDAGVETEYRIFKGVPHDFLFYGFPESYEAYDLICGWIREV